MLRRNDSVTLIGLAAAITFVAGTALAQANPELGETDGTTPTVGADATAGTDTGAAAQGTWQPPTGGQSAAAADTTTDTAAEEPAGDTDHQSVIGHFGVGLFGVIGVPAMGCTGLPAACTMDQTYTVSAPALGMRYWLDAGMAVEVALGMGIESSGGEFDPSGPGATVEQNGPSYIAFALHGGLPLVFAESKHFAFELVPELNFGFATGSWDDTTAANADVDLSGLMFQLGARVGAEIQFGFIDIPQLSLQGSVGLHLGLESRGASTSGGDASASSFRFGTSVQGEPWDIFTGALTAIYYF